MSLSDNLLEQLQQAVAKARAGERAEALSLFNAVLAQHPDHEDALVWKAALVSDPQEAIVCLEQVLRLNPHNQRAQVGLEWAKRRKNSAATSALAPQEAAVPENPTAEKPVQAPEVIATPEKPDEPLAPQPAPAEAVPQPKIASAAPKLSGSVETKSAPPPYKKRRLTDRENHLPPLDLPPEAVAWTKPDRAERAERKRNPAKPIPESPVFRASTPQVVFRIAPQVRQALSGKFPLPVPAGVRLRWPLLFFGVALLIAFLAFPLNVLAPVLGILAILLAISGVVLFNRARF